MNLVEKLTELNYKLTFTSEGTLVYENEFGSLVVTAVIEDGAITVSKGDKDYETTPVVVTYSRMDPTLLTLLETWSK